MIPILMQDEKTVGFLKESLSCVVTEERNGVFELSLTYPVTGALFDKLQIDRFVKAKPNDTADLQLFRIYEVTKPMNGVVTVNAEHVSYALSNFPVDEINITGTATQAINAVLSDVTYDLDYFDKVNPFMVATTDMDAVKAFSFKIGSARAALGGTEGSILDVFGGEYEFDNYTIRLHKNRGKDTGIVIAYGKNMTDIKVTTSLESAYTALYPYAVKDDRLYIANVWEFETEPTLTFIEYDPIMPVQNNAGIADRMLIRDFTNEFVKDETVSNRTLAEKAEKWLQEHDINSPSVNVTVSFVQLWESSEYEELKALESVSLCDWVTVRHKDLGIDMKAQVVKTVYDTIAERYNKIELGSAKANFGDTIRQATDDLTRLVQSIDTAAISSQITREYQAAIQRATKAITGAEYGAVRLSPSNCPNQITIANHEIPERATKVWRWNMGGLGYSPNGYDGPYTTAITAGGEIVADFITAGTLTANIIRAGILTSVNGRSSFNLESGLLKSSNIEVTGGTIQIGNADYYTYIANGSIAQHMTSGGGLIGGLVPIGIVETGNVSEGLYCSENVKGVGLYQRQSNGNFNALAHFTSSASQINSPLTVWGDLSLIGDLSTSGELSVGGQVISSLDFKGENGIAFGGYYALWPKSGDLAFGLGGKNVVFYGNNLNPAASGANYIGEKSKSWFTVCASYFDACYNGSRYGSFGGAGNAVYLAYNGAGASDGLKLGKVSGSNYTAYVGISDTECIIPVKLNTNDIDAGTIYTNGVQVQSTEDIKQNIKESGSALDAIRGSKIYTYNLISKQIVPEVTQINVPEPDPEEGVVIAQSEEETLNGALAAEVSEHTSTGFVIGRETPDAVLSEDGAHIDLYAMAAFNWRATQELLERIEQLEARL